MYESSQQVAPGVVVHYARSTPTFWGAHYVLCLHGPNGTYESTFARVLTEFDTSQLTLLAWNAPDRPNGFVPRPPPPAVEKKAVSDEENILNSSKRQSWTNSLEAYAEHAVTLMQNLFYTPFSILAHDDGAVTAMHVAAKHAAYVRAVVIWQCTAKITPRHLQELKAQQYMPQITRVFFNDDDKTEWFERLCSDRSRLLADCTPQLSQSLLGAVNAPVLILQSRNDKLCAPDQALYIQQNTANVRIATCNTPTGMIHHDDFHWFREQVQQFLSDM